MKHGVAMHVCHLKVGDVVRPIRGGLLSEPGAPAITMTLADGSRKIIESTRGYRNPPVGGPEDFRDGYDAMVVIQANDNYVDFMRPYCHVGSNGAFTAIGFEHVRMVSRDHGGYWYELLS